MTTALTILVAIIALYFLFKIREIVMKILLGLVVVGLVVFVVARLLGLDLWRLL